MDGPMMIRNVKMKVMSPQIAQNRANMFLKMFIVLVKSKVKIKKGKND
jgi:hypothetical protein